MKLCFIKLWFHYGRLKQWIYRPWRESSCMQRWCYSFWQDLETWAKVPQLFIPPLCAGWCPLVRILFLNNTWSGDHPRSKVIHFCHHHLLCLQGIMRGQFLFIFCYWLMAYYSHSSWLITFCPLNTLIIKYYHLCFKALLTSGSVWCCLWLSLTFWNRPEQQFFFHADSIFFTIENNHLSF